MKRDLHLVRALLLHFEEKPDDKPERHPKISSYSDLEVAYHLILMNEAGLIRCEPETTPTGRVIRVLAFSLTWKGHEFLDAARSEKLWRKAMVISGKKLGSISFEMLQTLLIQMAQKAIVGTVA